MKVEDLFKHYPERLRASSERPNLLYQRVPDHFAVHGPVPPSFNFPPVARLDDSRIAIYRGKPEKRLVQHQPGRITPVYSLQPGGVLAIPTGLIFVRFADAVNAEKRRQALRQAGYTVKQLLPYAPNAAWVAAESGEIAAALQGISRLESLPDVVNIEPQMLSQRMAR